MPTKKKYSSGKKHKKHEEVVEEEEEEVEEEIDKKSIRRLKKKANEWLDYDDQIKELADKLKKYKKAKQEREEGLIKMMNYLKVGDQQLDVTNQDGKMRGRIYRHVSITKVPLKEDTIKDALMESIHDEKRVTQLMIKINKKRGSKERVYIKRTKGAKN